MQEQNHYSTEQDTGDHLNSLVPFGGTGQLGSQQNWPIYNSLYTDEITCSVDHGILLLFWGVLFRFFFVQPYCGKQIRPPELCRQNLSLLSTPLAAWKLVVSRIHRQPQIAMAGRMYSYICVRVVWLSWTLCTKSWKLPLQCASTWSKQNTVKRRAVNIRLSCHWTFSYGRKKEKFIWNIYTFCHCQSL